MMKNSTVAVSIEGLLEQLPEGFNIADRELIQRAYRVAEKAHRPQKRASGEPYITHCLAVASILCELRVPPEVVAAGLLHDTVEDTEITLDDLRRDFGEEIANLVDGVTKLTNLPRVSRSDQHADAELAAQTEADLRASEAQEQSQGRQRSLLGRRPDLVSETLRKTFLAMGDDVRIVLIKLADRLHNMRTLGFMPEAKRKRIARQTLDIFAPLANRMGIWQIKWELEDLGFRHVDPEKYKEIATNLDTRREAREKEIRVIVADIKRMLVQAGIKGEVSGRPKHIYSIYKKMTQKDKPFEMVRDVRAVRVIVPDIPACYATLGTIHTRWRPLPNEFDDYIAAPKDNFYQSLHTAVIHEDGRPLEVQIRTPEMHENAEFGIAAHWRYKEGDNSAQDDAYRQRIDWLRRMMEWRQDVDDATEFVESMKTDVFRDRVYVFTPRGDIIDLPAGSTPIDFAYHIHTDVGHRCRGARVNAKQVPLSYELKTGEQVEILTAKRGGPSRDWLNPNLGLVKTQRAKSKMRVWFKKQDRDQNVTQGRELLEKELVRIGMRDKTNFDNLAREMGYRNVDALSLAIGHGDLSVNKVVGQISDEESPEEELRTVSSGSETETTDAIKVVGLQGLLTSIAKCCNPTPGDEIIGYITRGRGATIHRRDCPNILRTRDRERLVQVAWGTHIRTYPVPIRIRAYDRRGLIGDITNLFSNESINLIDANIKVNGGLADMQLIIEVRNIGQLSRLLARIENLPNVLAAQRNKPG